MWEITMVVDGVNKKLDRKFDTEHDADIYAEGIGFAMYIVSEVDAEELPPIKLSATNASTNPLGEVDKCWFCQDVYGVMHFDTEFDTAVHLGCIRDALEQDPENTEANIMKYLLKEQEVK